MQWNALYSLSLIHTQSLFPHHNPPLPLPLSSCPCHLIHLLPSHSLAAWRSVSCEVCRSSLYDRFIFVFCAKLLPAWRIWCSRWISGSPPSTLPVFCLHLLNRIWYQREGKGCYVKNNLMAKLFVWCFSKKQSSVCPQNIKCSSYKTAPGFPVEMLIPWECWRQRDHQIHTTPHSVQSQRLEAGESWTLNRSAITHSPSSR